MKLNIRPLTESDYEDTLVEWWKDWRWTPPPKDFLPDNGTGGFMVSDNDTPICAGFFYITNSKVGWCEWVISNMEYKNRKNRQQAFSLLIDTLTNVCQKSGMRYVYALLHNKSLVNVYENLGFVQGSKYTTEMIKIL
jgi:hypothetical protein|tara:strand:- start:227 stop:637 length:411 start_codon:yes stop_codon:yes gene_type:complete